MLSTAAISKIITALVAKINNHGHVVIEIDGKHHYAINDQVSPRLYAEMVAEDRTLRLAGYEVYRFGGYELQRLEDAHVVIAFFNALFQRHPIQPLHHEALDKQNDKMIANFL